MKPPALEGKVKGKTPINYLQKNIVYSIRVSIDGLKARLTLNRYLKVDEKLMENRYQKSLEERKVRKVPSVKCK